MRDTNSRIVMHLSMLPPPPLLGEVRQSWGFDLIKIQLPHPPGIQIQIPPSNTGHTRGVTVKPGSQYDAGASVASRTSRASSAKTGVPVHNIAFASVGGVVEGVSEGGSLYEPRPWRSKISATSASHAQRKR